jgi:hypothetical protein
VRYIIEVKIILDDEEARVKLESLKLEIENLILDKYHPVWDLQISHRESRSDMKYV